MGIRFEQQKSIFTGKAPMPVVNAVAMPTNVAGARLPVNYEAAVLAISNCEAIDECLEWADKSAALASYAKQAKDDVLMKKAVRVRDRAIRRAGELLTQIEPASGGDRGGGRGNQGEGVRPVVSRQKAAEDAGMSPHQQKQAIRVASVPADKFEAQVESKNPPTITALAEQGKKAAPASAGPSAPKPTPQPIIDLKGRDPGEFNRSLHFVAEFEDYAKALRGFDLEKILPALTPVEAGRIRAAITEVDAIHDRIITRI